MNPESKNSLHRQSANRLIHVFQENVGDKNERIPEAAIEKLADGLAALILELKKENPDLETATIARNIFSNLPTSVDNTQYSIRQEVMGRVIDSVLSPKIVDKSLAQQATAVRSSILKITDL